MADDEVIDDEIIDLADDVDFGDDDIDLGDDDLLVEEGIEMELSSNEIE